MLWPMWNTREDYFYFGIGPASPLAFQRAHFLPFVQPLISRSRSVAGNGISNCRSNESGNDKGMSAGRFSDKHNRSKRSLIARGKKRGHAHSRVKVETGAVH